MKTFKSSFKASVNSKGFNQQYLTSVSKSLRYKLNGNIGKIEAISGSGKLIYKTEANCLILAAHKCFSDHKRLILSPDIIWLNIIQQVAIHINNNSKSLRSKFVDFGGKKLIQVWRDGFRIGEKNDWENCFSEFSDKIKENIGADNHRNLKAEFTTTDTISRAAFDIGMMDCMQSYFNYRLVTKCGIPEITLEGEKKDWELLVEKAKGLEQYDLDWWTKKLIPVLDKFVDVFDDKIDLSYWDSFFKFNSGSGTETISGHILNLFAYDKKNKRIGSIAATDGFASGISMVPFIWEYFDTEYKMNFISGFFGLEQDKESFKPYIGWSINYEN